MFDEKSLDALFADLRNDYELEPDWEDIERAAHLAVAYSDAGVDLKAKKIDTRGAKLVKKHRPD